jgi:hypothetical protein
MTRSTIGFSTLAVVSLMAVSAALGDVPGRHPAYLHARTDLRRAERLMDWPEFRNVKHDLDDSARHVRASGIVRTWKTTRPSTLIRIGPAASAR